MKTSEKSGSQSVDRVEEIVGVDRARSRPDSMSSAHRQIAGWTLSSCSAASTASSAATPTSSCSAVGSRVANSALDRVRRRAWTARPSGESGLRSASTKVSTDSDSPATAADAAGQAARAARAAGRRSSWPAAEKNSIGAIRFEPQRWCSLARAARIAAPARSRRSPCARRRGRRRGRSRSARPAPGRSRSSPSRPSRSGVTACPCRGSGCRRGAGDRGADDLRRPRTAAGPRAAPSGRSGSPRRPRRGASGRAGTGPWRSGCRRSRACGPEATSIDPSGAARRGAPRGRPVDQQAVAHGHAAEPELLRLRRGGPPLAGGADCRELP